MSLSPWLTRADHNVETAKQVLITFTALLCWDWVTFLFAFFLAKKMTDTFSAPRAFTVDTARDATERDSIDVGFPGLVSAESSVLRKVGFFSTDSLNRGMLMLLFVPPVDTGLYSPCLSVLSISLGGSALVGSTSLKACLRKSSLLRSRIRCMQSLLLDSTLQSSRRYTVRSPCSCLFHLRRSNNSRLLSQIDRHDSEHSCLRNLRAAEINGHLPRSATDSRNRVDVVCLGLLPA